MCCSEGRLSECAARSRAGCRECGVRPSVLAAAGCERPRRGTKPMEERPCEPLATAAHGTDSSVEKSLEEGAAAPLLVSVGFGNGIAGSWSQRGAVLRRRDLGLVSQTRLNHVCKRPRSRTRRAAENRIFRILWSSEGTRCSVTSMCVSYGMHFGV